MKRFFFWGEVQIVNSLKLWHSARPTRLCNYVYIRTLLLRQSIISKHIKLPTPEPAWYYRSALFQVRELFLLPVSSTHSLGLDGSAFRCVPQGECVGHEHTLIQFNSCTIYLNYLFVQLNISPNSSEKKSGKQFVMNFNDFYARKLPFYTKLRNATDKPNQV